MHVNKIPGWDKYFVEFFCGMWSVVGGVVIEEKFFFKNGNLYFPIGCFELIID